jgi:hypothetical protein
MSTVKTAILAKMTCDMTIIESARTIIVNAMANARDLAIFGPDDELRNDVDSTVKNLDIALDYLYKAIETMEPHIKSHLEPEPEPHGSRDTFVPHPNEEHERFNAMQD